MDKERLFDKFLEKYFDNIKKELPESYRARQLESGGAEAVLVLDFETRFLKKPFMEALEEASP